MSNAKFLNLSFFSLLVFLATVLSGCGGGGGSSTASTTPTISQVKSSLSQLNKRWTDANALYWATPPIARSTVIAEMQKIKRDADAVIVPSCLGNTKTVMTDDMKVILDDFLGLISGGAVGNQMTFDYSTVFNAVIDAACTNYVAPISSLTLSAPFSNSTGLVNQPVIVFPSAETDPNPYQTYYIQSWKSATEIMFLKYFADPSVGDVVDFYITDVSNTSQIAIFAGPNVRYCGVKNLTPICSSWGITVDRAAGTIIFVNTPLTEMTGGTTSTGRTGTLNGTLHFAPF